jgi:hypothetical protein
VKRGELTLALQQRNPQSQFLFLTKKPTVIELATLNPAKALQLAEQGLVENPNNVDFMMTVADHDMNLEKNLPKVLSYALRILELVQGPPQPADISPADWEKKKAYFYLGYDNYALAGELTDKGRAVEAVKFSKLCADMDSPFRSLALKNLEALRNEYNLE